MSNCKRIHIGGIVPFNCVEHDGLKAMFGQMNAPSFGYRVAYNGSAGYRPSEHGGKTALYKFTIEGVEAVSDFWLAHLVKNIRESGGTIVTWEARDIEADYAIRLPLIDKLIEELKEKAQ